MIELSEQQRQELRVSEPLVLDPQTGETYVLVRSVVYERLRGFLGEEEWADDVYRLALHVFARDGWDDPRMDMYDELDPRRQS